MGHFAEDSEVDLSPGMGRTLGFQSEPMKSAVLLFATFLLLSLATSTAAAKSSSIGIYAVIDEVKFDQDGPSSNLVRISGVFIVPRPMSSGEYQTPQRGYLYFRISPGAEQAARKDCEPTQGSRWNGSGRRVCLLLGAESERSSG